MPCGEVCVPTAFAAAEIDLEEMIDLDISPPKDFMMLADTMRRDAASA